MLEQKSLKVHLTAIEQLEKVQTDEKYEEQLWNDRSTRTVVNMDFARQAAAGIRARQEQTNAATLLGVVMMVPQMQSGDEWEAFAEEQKEPRLAIEAKEVISGLLEKDIQRPVGVVGGLPTELRANLSAETGTQEATSEEGQETETLIRKASA